MTVTVTVRFYAAARDAAGVRECEVAEDSADAIAQYLTARFGTRMAEVLASATLLTAGERLPAADRTVIPDGAVVDVLPPFAGG